MWANENPSPINWGMFNFLVEITRLELARVSPLDPKSSASASFAISPNDSHI